MNCPKCGAYVGDNTRFCSQCGHDIKKSGGSLYGQATGNRRAYRNKLQSGSSPAPAKAPSAKQIFDDFYESGSSRATGTIKNAAQRIADFGESMERDFFTEKNSPRASQNQQVQSIPGGPDTPHGGQDEQKSAPKPVNVIAIVVAVIAILVSIVPLGIVSCGDVYYDEYEQDWDEIEWIEDTVYSDSIVDVTLNGWSEFYDTEPPLGYRGYGSYINESDSSALYVLGGFEGYEYAGVSQKGTDLTEGVFDSEGTQAFLQNTFASAAMSLSDGPYQVGPDMIQIDDFDFEIAPDTTTLMQMGADDDEIIYFVSGNYSLRGNDAVAGTMYFVRTEYRPYYLLMYTVIGEGADIEAERDFLISSFYPGCISWYEE